MVAAKYIGLAFVVLVGCCAISEATFSSGGGGGGGVGIKINLVVDLCGGVLSLVGQTLNNVLNLVGNLLGGVIGLLNSLLGGLLGGGGAGSIFGYGNHAPNDVATFIGDTPTSNAAALELFIKIFVSIHPFFDKGCGNNFGKVYTKALYVCVTIIASSNDEYYNGAKFLKRVRVNGGDISGLYDKLKVNDIIAEWDSLVRSEGGDVYKISGPKGFAYQYANFLFLQLRNRRSYLNVSGLLGGLLKSVFGLVGFAGKLVLKEVNGILGLLINIVDNLSLGSGYSGQFGGWTSEIVSACNSFNIDGHTFINTGCSKC